MFIPSLVSDGDIRLILYWHFPLVENLGDLAGRSNFFDLSGREQLLNRFAAVPSDAAAHSTVVPSGVFDRFRLN